ncbi:SRPBCC family protein [Planococcus sp. N028]|uniref:SRPBCC family protein n=1 Tax=Planococcus shixiaomingii TaxID=3058393 RepID=A0ABT8MYS0_9BACL|nr:MULTISPECIES: SRPBCC family protein [unclassified Planococcus (in: firmicutes)]MDN7240791.1 SRPBCC family protein [Planococcus sp. N028]WKA53041.1 SRPBCC family protein [Planococcus sp. N022]
MVGLINEPVAKAEMLIRRPVAEVFQAFVDPAITTKFWFTDSSGRLETGENVKWEWAMYGASTNVHVIEIEENQRILIEWGEPKNLTPVEWVFSPRGDTGTYVTITNAGFHGTPDDIVKQAIDSMGGFTMVLCGLKALLEHNIELNLVADKAPDAHVKQKDSAS